MLQFNVTGMSCAACSARVEKAVNALDGVDSCSVSLLTNSMGVEGSVSAADICAAVENAGYGCKEKGAADAKPSMEDAAEALEDHETPLLKRRLITSLGFLIVLMYFSMGHSMWGWPVPEFLDNPMSNGIIQLMLAGIVMIINKKFFTSGFKALINRAPNMDTLVAMGSAVSYAWSIYALLAMSYHMHAGHMMVAHHYMHEFYFESAAMILTLITVGKMLEARSKGKTTDALKGLMKLAPKTAVLFKDGVEKEVPIEEVKQGDVFVVKPGENVPVDGIIIEGSSAINEAALTGESIPVDKEVGDGVSAATTNTSGYIKCQATRVGEDTTLSQIIQMVSDAAATKAPIAKIADKVAGVFVPTVISIAVVTFIVWMFINGEVGYALARAISVLVISCPCSLGLATPVAIMVGNGLGAKNGILFKTAVSLEQTGHVAVVALDKTGTITSGEPKVTDILPAEGYTDETLVARAFALESKSEHPLAKAIVAYADEKSIKADSVDEFAALPGNGLTAKLAGKVLYGGSNKFIKTVADVPAELQAESDKLAEEGKTPLFFSEDGKLCGIIAVADTIKEDSPQAVRELQKMGIHVVMLTGDNERTAKAIGAQAGVDEVIAGVLPDGKEAVIRQLQTRGKFAMVGDGINDAPALTRADIGIAIGAGADVAIDAADVVLMQSKLSDVPTAVRLSRATLRNIHENLFWAFFYNSIGIPIAAGVLIPIGVTLNPMIGAAAMSLSSFCVVTNALRLNLFKLHDSSKDKPLKNKAVAGEPIVIPEGPATPVAQTACGCPLEDAERRVMRIEDMMCENCEKHVKEALEAIDGVEYVEASHTAGTAIITLSKDVDNDLMQKAVEAEDYVVLGFDNNSSCSGNDGETRTLHIEGMMCENCEKHVREALEAIDGVEKAVASHTAGTAVVTLSKDVDNSVMRKAVEAEDYVVLMIDGGGAGVAPAANKTLTIKVNGMMCENCEKHVKDALEAIDGVDNAVTSHTAGTAVVTLSKDVDHDLMKTAIEKEDYEVVSFEDGEK